MCARSRGAWLACALALALAGEARAQSNSMTLNPAQTGSVVAAPYFTDPSGVFTSILVTNASSSDTILHVHVINGDAGEDWGEQDFNCGMTPTETTLILVTPDGPGNAKVEIECSDQGRLTPGGDLVNLQPGQLVDLYVPGARGLIVLTQLDVVTETATQYVDRFIADWQVVDFAAGVSYASEAATFQTANAGACFGPGAPADCLADGAIEFGVEVSSFPTILGTDFFAPTPSGSVDVELVLITLDGREGVPPRQKVDGFYYDDDEVRRSFNALEFECMDVVRLRDIDPNLTSDRLCSGDAPLGCVGHIVLSPDTVSVLFSLHDVPPLSDGFGGGTGMGDQVRLSAVLGWVVHRFSPGAELLPGVGPIGNPGANARLFQQSSNVLAGLAGDIPALDLR